MQEDDLGVERISSLEAVKFLDSVKGAPEPNTTVTTSDGEEDEVESKGSYDFAAARTLKFLADKRIKEDHQKMQGKDRKDDDDDGVSPQIPEYNPARANWI
jgi:hypothetical protein